MFSRPRKLSGDKDATAKEEAQVRGGVLFKQEILNLLGKARRVRGLRWRLWR